MSQDTMGFRLEVLIEKDDPGFHAYCPALKGLHVYGDSVEEALGHAKEAATAYLESLIKHGEPVPIGVTAATQRRPSLFGRRRRTLRRTEDLQVACST